MTENNKYNINDLIASTLEQKPIDFENAFRDVLVDKLNDAIAAKKIEIAQRIYSNDNEVETEEETSEEE